MKLPDKGHVCELVTDGVVGDRVHGGDEVCRVSAPGSAGGAGVLCDCSVLGGFKSIRLNRKTHAHLARLGSRVNVASHSKVWKRLRVSEAHWCPICGTHVLHECHHMDDGSSLGDRVGVGSVSEDALAHVRRLCMKGVVISLGCRCTRM